MRLREWKHINTPATNSNTTSAASTSSNTGFKKRLDKLIKYHGRHPAAEVEYILVGLLTKDKLEFAEHYDDGQVVEYKISIDPITEEWQVKIFVNNQLNDDISGTYWISLLKTLSPYLTIPVVSTPEYRDILHEWVAMNNKTSSTGGYKKRFEKLIKYHIDHASSELESITKKDIKDYSFHLGEHYNSGHDEFDREILVAYDANSDTFFIHIFVDGKEVESIQRDDYENFVKAIEPYMYLPDGGTQEYDDLLIEWVAMNKKQGSNSSTSQPTSKASSKTNKEKFRELTDYMIANASSFVEKAEVVRLDETGFTYKELRKKPNGSEYTLIILVGYSRFNARWSYEFYYDTEKIKEGQGNGMKELLSELRFYVNVPRTGTTEYDSLVEWVAMKNTNSTATTQNASTNNNSSSIAPRFKTNKDKFEYIIEYMTNEDKRLHNVTNTVTTRLDNNGFTYKEYRLGGLSLNEEYVVTADCQYSKAGSWELIVKSEKDTETKILVDAKGTGFEDLLKKLGIFLSVPDYHISTYFKLIKEELIESASFADDFKLYENLWEDTNWVSSAK